MYYIKHDRNNVFIWANSLDSCQRHYYMQWRNDEGKIPWKMFYDGCEIDPVNGEAVVG